MPFLSGGAAFQEQDKACRALAAESDICLLFEYLQNMFARDLFQSQKIIKHDELHVLPIQESLLTCLFFKRVNTYPQGLNLENSVL